MLPLTAVETAILSSAYQIARINDLHDNWTTDRSLQTYIRCLSGLDDVLKYVDQHPNLVRRLLDVGIGRGYYLPELHKIFNEWKMFGSTLSPDMVGGIGRHIPAGIVGLGVEQLADFFPKQSFGVILSVCGIGYSPLPDHTAAVIDQLLVPGGILKMDGWIDDLTVSGLRVTGNHRYREIFTDLGHNVQLAKYDSVLVSIKPE